MKRSRSLNPRAARAAVPALLALLLTTAPDAHASMFHGETLDAIANGISWVVLVIAPVIGITVFWLVHILPEKIAHKKKHPQTKLIQCLCLMSLVFGGLLWPFAWILAYSKPVLHKLAYGTDVDESLAHHDDEAKPDEANVDHLRARVAELEAKLSTTGGKA